MSTHSAWLLSLANGRKVAVGKFELKHVETLKNPIFIPSAPAYCNLAIEWQSTFLPLIDIEAYVSCAKEGLKPSGRPDSVLYIAIIIFRDVPGQQVNYGGVIITDTPRLVSVSQEQSRFLNILDKPWKPIAHGVFESDGSHIPILNLAAMFGRSAHELGWSSSTSSDSTSVEAVSSQSEPTFLYQ